MNLEAARIILRDLRHPKIKSWIFFSPSSLGETLSLCSVCGSFIEKFGHQITLVIPPGHEFIAQCYPNVFFKIFQMPLDEMRQFFSFNLYPRNFFELDFPINTWSNHINDTNPFLLHELFIKTSGKQGLDITNLYRFNLRLPWDSICGLPQIARDDCAVISKSMLTKHRIEKPFLLILSGNNTNKNIPSVYLNRISKEFQKLGLDIIVNSHGSILKADLNETDNLKIINLSVPETVALATQSALIIGGANGLVSLLCALDLSKKIHIFLPNYVLTDWDKLIFRESWPIEGSIKFSWPEIISDKNIIYEYKVAEEPTEQEISQVIDLIMKR